jgi:hypothetical protein
MPLVAVLACAARPAAAVDYIVDFTRMTDYESLRPVIERCRDFGAMEFYRDRMQAAANLNDMREVFERTGLGMFNDCPEGISGDGIALVKSGSGAR